MPAKLVQHLVNKGVLTVERAHEAIRPHASAAFAHDPDGQSPIAIVAEIVRRSDNATWTQPELSVICTAVARAVCAAHGFVPGTIALVDAGALPRTTSGKTERYRCAALLDGDVLLHVWTPAAAADGERQRAAS